MKNIILSIIVLSVGSLTVSFEAEAGNRHHRRAAKRQHRAIHKKAKSGDITRKEARAAHKDVRDYNRTRKSMKRDNGYLDKGERAELREMRRENAQNIKDL